MNSVLLCLLCKQASAPKPHQHAQTPTTPKPQPTGHLEPLGAEQAPEEEQSKHSKRSRPSIQEVQGKHPVVQDKHQGEASQEQEVK
jgi:hypothetical protein